MAVTRQTVCKTISLGPNDLSSSVSDVNRSNVMCKSSDTLKSREADNAFCEIYSVKIVAHNGKTEF